MTTKRVDVSFAPKDLFQGEPPFIAIEPQNEKIEGDGLARGIVIGLTLPEGTSSQKAGEIVAYLNANVRGLMWTAD
jgi:hypothetical protein